MSFRTRLFLALLGAILVPLSLIAFGVRHEMERRLTAEYEQRVQTLAGIMQSDLTRQSQSVADRLDALAIALGQDNQFRLAIIQGDQNARRRFFDYAGDAMRLTGLAMLQLEDSAGRILSSGQFRNAFDRLEPELPDLLAASPESTAIVRVLTPDASLLSLARLKRFQVAGRAFALIGGVAMDSAAVSGMTRDPALAVRLELPATAGGKPPAIHSDSSVVRQVVLPFLDMVDGPGQRADTACLIVTQSLATLQSLRRSVDLWLLAALGVALLLAIPGAVLLSRRISQPLQELAEKTAAVDLERLDQEFVTDRSDEIGVLANGLSAMTARLRAGTQRLREAERRATVGDLSRQVNHDIKNGLIPIRNVVRHLSEVARSDPAALPGVFDERVGTLDSSIDYLDTLSRNYAKLSPDLGKQPCDLNRVIREMAREIGAGPVSLSLAESLPMVRADPIVLRRILENLVGNAVESLAPDGSPAGRGVEVSSGLPQAVASSEARGQRGIETFGVRIATESTPEGSNPLAVVVTVADTGRGMTKQELDRAFDDFYTTKSTGTGLGLSIVRRLIIDLGGTLRVETEPGRGTTMRVELPVA